MSTESTQTCPYLLGCRVDHLGMSSLSGSLFLKEIDSPSLGRLGLPVTLQLGLGPCKPFPFRGRMLTGVVLHVQPYCWELPWATLLSYPGDTMQSGPPSTDYLTCLQRSLGDGMGTNIALFSVFLSLLMLLQVLTGRKAPM